MSSFNYARSQATAERLLAKFGAAAVIRRTVNAGGGDPWNPPSSTTTDYACTAVVTDYGKREIDGTLIRQTDRKVLVSTKGLTIIPTTTDVLAIDGQTLSIVNVSTLKPASVVVMYELQCRTV